MAQQAKRNDTWVIAGIAFIGCCVIGAGIGKLTDQPGNWSTIGAGVGFLVVALLLLARKS